MFLFYVLIIMFILNYVFNKLEKEEFKLLSIILNKINNKLNII